MILAGGNNITLSQHNNTVTISAANQTDQTHFVVQDILITGNTSGTLADITSGTAYFAGGNNVTLSQNGQSITISAFNQSNQTGSIVREISLSGNTSGTLTDITSGTAYFAGGNNVTLSQNGQSITISAFNQSVQTQSIVREISIGGNTSGTLTDITSGTAFFMGGNNVTLSQNGQSITISAAGGGGTLSSYEPYSLLNAVTANSANNANSSATAYFFPFNLPEAVAVRHMNMLLSFGFGGIVGSQTNTLNWAIYSRGTGANSTLISQFTSSSLSSALQIAPGS